MTIRGVDVSYWQDDSIWDAAVAWGARFAYIRAGGGYLADPRYLQHRTHARRLGLITGAYWDIMHHNPPAYEPMLFDPARQADAFVSMLADDDELPAAWDVEQLGVTRAMLGAAVRRFKQRSRRRQIGYSSQMAWYALIGRGAVELADLSGWLTNYNGGALELIDVWPQPLFIQGTGTGSIPGYARNVDLDEFNGSEAEWAALTGKAPVITPNHIKLGPHHMQGGNTTGAWLQLVPTVAKFVGDLGGSVDALPGTLTIGRLVDDGLLDGNGFDVNRYTDAGADPIERAAAYLMLLHPYILSNPHIQVWEGPNEQILRSNDQAEAADPDARAKFDADRQRFMEWYGDFAYAFAAGLHALGKRAGIGSWASGQPRPEHNLWRFWGRALQATVDFGAIECRHDYAGIDVTGLLRCVYDNAEFEKLGFVGVPQVITELGADVGGTGWRQLFHNDIGACYAQLIKPWLDQVAGLPWFLGACWYTDGGKGWENYDVSGTQIVSYLAGYQAPPPEETMPITKVQQAAYLSNLDDAKHDLDNAAAAIATTRAAIAALTPDDAPAWKVGDVARAVANPLQLYDAAHNASGSARPNYTSDINIFAVSADGAWLEVFQAPALFVRSADVKHK